MTVRVLHVTECYASGVRRAIDAVASGVTDVEHLLLWRDPDEEGAAPSAQFTQDRVLPESPWAWPGAVRRAVRDLDPDLIHAHSSWAGVFCRITDVGVPVVYEPHGFRFADPRTGRAMRWLSRGGERLLAPRTALNLALSEHEAASAQQLAPNVPVTIVPNVPSLGPAARGESPHPACVDPAPRVVMIGRMVSQKDPEFFCDVAELVRAEVPGVEFRWLGSGSDEQVRMAEDRGVSVSGWLNADELEQELAQPQLYLHTARYEGFPISVLDAASMGLPILARDIPCFNGTGIETIEDSPQAAATAVINALRDPQRRLSAAEKGRLLLDRMNLQTHNAVLGEAYRSAMG